MARATKKRAFFALYCTACQEKDGKRRENYKILINTQNQNPKEFQLRKYCPTCNKHQPHKTKQISRAQNT
ncbi:50S ribosomal protein L33 [Candidatus Gracilibacteria bacterium]|nr:50S ribosomal protein L33 [Candidatus Gracilibacteria bacterium]MCF7819650.1 50S ribosomal protein L33 [Candidatus Gracilibacteria bacterium]